MGYNRIASDNKKVRDGLKLEDNPTYDLEEQVQFVIGTLKRGEFEFEFDCDGQLILSTGLYLWADGNIREEKETKLKKELTEAQLKTLDEYFSAGNKF